MAMQGVSYTKKKCHNLTTCQTWSAAGSRPFKALVKCQTSELWLEGVEGGGDQEGKETVKKEDMY